MENEIYLHVNDENLTVCMLMYFRKMMELPPKSNDEVCCQYLTPTVYVESLFVYIHVCLFVYIHVFVINFVCHLRLFTVIFIYLHVHVHVYILALILAYVFFSDDFLIGR